MKIAKILQVNIAAYRDQLDDKAYSYTEDEKTKLRKLYEYFECGYFDKAIRYSDGWSTTEREMIPCEIWDILYDISMGVSYQVIK